MQRHPRLADCRRDNGQAGRSPEAVYPGAGDHAALKLHKTLSVGHGPVVAYHWSPSREPAQARNGAKGDTSFVRIYTPLGRSANIRPGNLAGAIANEASIDSSLIGSIEIADKFSLVEVPDSDADTIIEALNRSTVRGKRVKARRERF